MCDVCRKGQWFWCYVTISNKNSASRCYRGLSRIQLKVFCEKSSSLYSRATRGKRNTLTRGEVRREGGKSSDMKSRADSELARENQLLERESWMEYKVRPEEKRMVPIHTMSHLVLLYGA
jgi:hypothetical protein